MRAIVVTQGTGFAKMMRKILVQHLLPHPFEHSTSWEMHVAFVCSSESPKSPCHEYPLSKFGHFTLKLLSHCLLKWFGVEVKSSRSMGH